MKHEDKAAALRQIFRWENYPVGSDSWIYNGRHFFFHDIPDYPFDIASFINACDMLNPHLLSRYGEQLQEDLNERAVGFVPDRRMEFASLARLTNASAEQRCDALIKAAKLWKD